MFTFIKAEFTSGNDFILTFEDEDGKQLQVVLLPEQVANMITDIQDLTEQL